MTTTIEAAMSLAAAAALIVLATFLVESARAWGRDRHMRDMSAGVLLGLVSVAQMFLPLEPFPGVIIDLRIVPVVLAGAFLRPTAAVIAAGMAVCMRWGIGGTGMVSGILGIVLAGLIGQTWQFTISRLSLPKKAGYLLLGLSTTLTMVAAFILPTDVAHWFFRNAAPALSLVYIAALPIMAWILDNRVGLETRFDKSGREAFQAHGLRVMSQSALLRHLALEATDRPDDAAVAVLTVEISDIHPALHKRNMRQAIETILLRTKAAVPEATLAAFTGKGQVLLPLPRHMLQDITPIVKSLRQAICGTPLNVAGAGQFWPSCKIGLIPMSKINSAEPVKPAHILKSIPANRSLQRRGAALTAPFQVHRSAAAPLQFEHISDPDLLFLKASLLSR